MSALKIVTDRLKGDEVAVIQGIAPQAEVVKVSRYEDLLREIVDADIILGPKLVPAELAQARRVKWIQVGGVGIDRMISPEFIASDIVLTNSRGKTSVNIAEHAFALLLALSRKISAAIDWQRKKGYGTSQEPQPKIREVAGDTLGLIGLGNIGKEVAKRGKGFAMKVLAVDPGQVEIPETVDRLFGSEGFDTLLSQSDYLVVCCPLTPQTEGLMAAAEFDRMKETAYLINVARGKIVDQPALIKALKSKQIAGAGLDVTDPEPLPPEHPLWTMENVILTPHWAGKSPKVWDRIFPLFCENLKRYLASEPLLNVVDKARGY